MRIFVAGTGFTGSRIAKRLAASGHEVVGMNRSGRLEGAPGVRMVAGDVLSAGGLEGLRGLPEMDAMVSALSGTGQTDRQRYRELYVEGPGRVVEALRWRTRTRVWWLGSTGVYGESAGGWVDEETPVNPAHRNGEVQVEAEEALYAGVETASVLRLSGLYGPGRTRLIRQALRRRAWFKPEVWANQIHAEDVAGVVGFLAERELWPRLLLVSDDRPARRQEIFEWIREMTGCPEGIYDEDHPSRRGRNRGDKRVSNRRLRDLGADLRYPDYRAGLAPLIRQQEWPGAGPGFL